MLMVGPEALRGSGQVTHISADRSGHFHPGIWEWTLKKKNTQWLLPKLPFSIVMHYLHESWSHLHSLFSIEFCITTSQVLHINSVFYPEFWIGSTVFVTQPVMVKRIEEGRTADLNKLEYKDGTIHPSHSLWLYRFKVYRLSAFIFILISL